MAINDQDAHRGQAARATSSAIERRSDVNSNQNQASVQAEQTEATLSTSASNDTNVAQISALEAPENEPVTAADDPHGNQGFAAATDLRSNTETASLQRQAVAGEDPDSIGWPNRAVLSTTSNPTATSAVKATEDDPYGNQGFAITDDPYGNRGSAPVPQARQVTGSEETQSIGWPNRAAVSAASEPPVTAQRSFETSAAPEDAYENPGSTPEGNLIGWPNDTEPQARVRIAASSTEPDSIGWPNRSAAIADDPYGNQGRAVQPTPQDPHGNQGLVASAEATGQALSASNTVVIPSTGSSTIQFTITIQQPQQTHPVTLSFGIQVSGPEGVSVSFAPS